MVPSIVRELLAVPVVRPDGGDGQVECHESELKPAKGRGKRMCVCVCVWCEGRVKRAR